VLEVGETTYTASLGVSCVVFAIQSLVFFTLTVAVDSYRMNRFRKPDGMSPVTE